MFRFKSGTFQFVLLFIYIQNKQKTHERKRTVLEIFPYHHYTGHCPKFCVNGNRIQL